MIWILLLFFTIADLIYFRYMIDGLVSFFGLAICFLLFSFPFVLVFFVVLTSVRLRGNLHHDEVAVMQGHRQQRIQ